MSFELDRTLLDFSSKMAEPFCTVWELCCYRLVAPLDPEKFENCTTRTREIAVRVFIGLGAVLGVFLLCAFPVPMLFRVVALGIGVKLLRAIGFALQKGGFTHVRGEAPEKTLNYSMKVMSWNICGVGGGLSLDHGGVVHWRSRVGALIEKVKKEEPDVLLLQEVYDTALGEALIDGLKKDYAHFFIHLGPNVMGSIGGCMILSKCAVRDFSHTSFTNNHWTLNRGFETLELKASPQDIWPSVRIIGTHLIHGDTSDAKNNRMEQVAQIVDSLRETMPTILAGDLNIERDGEGKQLLEPFCHAYKGHEPTCTNELTAKWSSKERGVREETIDYISLFKKGGAYVRFEDCHLVKAFDESYNTKTALSDHHGLSVVVKGF